MKAKMIAFLKDEQGLTMVEYAVAGGLVCAGAVAAFTALGGKVAGMIQYISNQIIVP